MEHAQNQYNITLTEEQQIRVHELVDKRKSSREIARILGISDMKMWRNMKLMGLNGSKFPHMKHSVRKKRSKFKKVNESEEEIFDCDSQVFIF